MKRNQWLLIVVGLLSLLLVGCQASDQPSTTQNSNEEQVLKFGVTNFGDSLEPTDNYFGWTVMRYGLGECLVKFDSQMNSEAWLATDWQIDDDELTWTFMIDDTAVFSNNHPVTAQAVKESIERTFDLSPRAQAMFEYDEISADGQELTIKTKEPVPTLPGMLADPLFIIIDTSVTDRDYVTEGPICTGPYQVREYSKTKAVMERNPNYWNGEVPYDVVEIPTIDDPNTRAMALQSGEIDLAINIGSGDLSLFDDEEKYTVSSIDSLRTVLARMNSHEDRILSDRLVREALISSLDRDTYAKVLLHDTFTPGGPLMPPSVDYGFDQLKDPNTYDLDRANQLLDEAGWDEFNSEGYRVKDGEVLELDFIYYSGREELPIYAEATQADAKEVGIKINLDNVDYNVLDEIGIAGDYDLLISNILTLQAGDPEVFINQYWKTNIDGNNPQNGSGYSNAEFDQLSDQLAVEFDQDIRRNLVIQMQEIILDDAATVVFGYPQTNMVSSTKVKNAEIFPCDYYWLTTDIAPSEL